MDLNPYQWSGTSTEPRIPVRPGDDSGFRLLAALLWVIALGWSLVCLASIAIRPASFFVWAPGFAVTVGYAWRAFFTCPPTTVKKIWCLSLLVQGLWLLACCVVTIAYARVELLFNPLGVWWLISTLFSLGGVYCDGSWKQEVE